MTLKVDLLAPVMKGCGLRFLGFRYSTGIPAFAAGMVTSCYPGEGRRDRTVGLDDPALVPKANADWYALATEYGLFSAKRQFLLSINVPIGSDEGETAPGNEMVEPVWGLVELLEDWDIMGKGAAAGITGGPYGRPAFVMSALDGSVFVQGTVWQDCIGTAVLPNPHRVQSLRNVVQRSVGKPYRTAAENEDALTWLARGDDGRPS
ncbi:hypothetical protein ACQPZZ_35610 [Microbispora sp. CA-135349]|uniref:hypothetical protein n=1 Tax=Microbispora sp. CA-135349 TaxID=3239953 RepID=UPI003D8DDFD0